MQTHLLEHNEGLEILGVDLSAPLDPALSQQLGKLYDQHGLLVIRDQHLTKRQLVEATHPFGGPELHPPADDTDPDAPGVSIISTRGAFGDVVPQEVEELVGDIDWHTDQAYIVAPNRGKLIYAVEVPEVGGKTGFLDGQRTYEALPHALKERIDGLHVIQSWRHAQATIARNKAYRIEGEKVLADDRFPDIAHRLVHEHPRTGRKVLFVPPLWSSGILELPGEEGRALLDELIAHIRKPEFAYWHSYRPGDLLAWDNWRFLHAAGGTPGKYRRTMWTVVIRGGPVFGRIIEPGESVAA
jgi:taurine dioxygenase